MDQPPRRMLGRLSRLEYVWYYDAFFFTKVTTLSCRVVTFVGGQTTIGLKMVCDEINIEMLIC